MDKDIKNAIKGLVISLLIFALGVLAAKNLPCETFFKENPIDVTFWPLFMLTLWISLSGLGSIFFIMEIIFFFPCNNVQSDEKPEFQMEFDKYDEGVLKEYFQKVITETESMRNNKNFI